GAFDVRRYAEPAELIAYYKPDQLGVLVGGQEGVVDRDDGNVGVVAGDSVAYPLDDEVALDPLADPSRVPVVLPADLLQDPRDGRPSALERDPSRVFWPGPSEHEPEGCPLEPSDPPAGVDRHAPQVRDGPVRPALLREFDPLDEVLRQINSGYR